MAKRVGATAFGGPGDPGTGHYGASGKNLNKNPWSFAELSRGYHTWDALGKLPFGTKLIVRNPKTGKAAVLAKNDVGQGGSHIPGVGARKIDIWHSAAKYLGFNGWGALEISPAPRGAKLGPWTGGKISGRGKVGGRGSASQAVRQQMGGLQGGLQPLAGSVNPMLGAFIGQLSGVPELGAIISAMMPAMSQQNLGGMGGGRGKGRGKGQGRGAGRGSRGKVLNVRGGLWPVGTKNAHDLGGVAAHHERARGNWQSDNAVDVGVPIGTPIIAMANGVIGRVDTRPLDGSVTSGGSAYLKTKGNQFWYKHMKKVIVRPGQRVKKGQIIGYSGEGNGVPHLHLGSLRGDPERLIGLR